MAGENPQNIKKVFSKILSYVFLILFIIMFIFPFIWMVSTSLKYPADVYKIPLEIFPRRITLDNFIKGWKYADFGRYTVNTITITILAVCGTLISSSLVGYGFARFKARASEVLFLVVLATMMIPSQVTLIPTYLLFAKLHWLDTFLPLIVPAWFGGGAFNIFLMRQFFKGIPKELDEAAYIDGANSFQIYVKILLPAVKPALLTVGLMSITYNWNDFFNPLIYLQTDTKFTLALGLQFFQTLHGSTDIQMLMAVSLLTLLPVLLLFFVAQKHFIEGIVMSGIKG